MANLVEKQSADRSLYCRDAHGMFTTTVTYLGKAKNGISRPEYISFVRNGHILTGYLKSDANGINENDIEFILSQIGRILSVPMAEVIRVYEDSCLQSPHSIISVSVAHKSNEEFWDFSSIQDELYHDYKDRTFAETGWVKKWIDICKRRRHNPPNVWDIYATSAEECEACLEYPGELAKRWAKKHGLTLVRFEKSLLKMLVFDILIGQTDRSPGNYGLLVDWEKKTAKLAPLFDNATLRKPGLSEKYNGFNYMLVDRTVFARTIAQKWSMLFFANAILLLRREKQIFEALETALVTISEDKRRFLIKRIQDSIDIIKTIVDDYDIPVASLTMPFDDEAIFQKEIASFFYEKYAEPSQIELIGEFDLEPKYRVVVADHCYFAKFSLYNRFTPKRIELMNRGVRDTHSILLPLMSHNLPSVNRQLNVYPWIDDTDLRQVIEHESKQTCYRIGLQCGELLRNIHDATMTDSDTYDVASQLNAFFSFLSKRDDVIPHQASYISFLKQHQSLLCRTHKSSLLHMDYVPKNIIMTNDKLTVIDWDSCEIGDPWLDFCDKGLAVSPGKQAWNAGVVDGYFCGDVPDEFWEYFKVLSVFALIRATVWAVKRNDITYAKKLELHLHNSYDDLQKHVPTWYTTIRSFV